jgi:hypothetical protein
VLCSVLFCAGTWSAAVLKPPSNAGVNLHLRACAAHLRSMCRMLSVLMTVVMPRRLACGNSIIMMNLCQL